MVRALHPDLAVNLLNQPRPERRDERHNGIYAFLQMPIRVNQAAQRCGIPLRAVAGCKPGTGAAITGRLSIIDAPQRVGEQFFLAGKSPIEIGKLDDKPLSLKGTMVSRNHCRLVPSATGWRVEDLKSTNGILVNRRKIEAIELCEGDILKVGEYEMRFSRAAPGLSTNAAPAPTPAASNDPFDENDFGSYDLAEIETKGTLLPPPPFAAVAVSDLPHEPLRAPGSGPACPCCEKVLAPNAKLCIGCGIKVPSGRPLVTSRGMDENFLVERAQAWLTVISFIMRIGLLPIASEAFGTKKARSVWIILGITFAVSTLFLALNWGEKTELQYGNLMLWCGSNAPAMKAFENEKQEVQFEIAKAEKALKKGAPANLTREEIKQIKQAIKESVPPVPRGEFHAYQLLTCALLHQGIFHFAGNMLFLLVFGLRVNELIGDLKFSIVYPILAIASGLAYMASTAGETLHPVLGASGAVMGLAGMYFVLFPVQRVHMVFWLRIGWVTSLYLKMFRMRGFWLLVLWTAFNDLLPMYLSRSRDHVAHWAHLGGFMAGMALAIGLLVSRQATARGGDLLSVLFGRLAWPLLGKPNLNLEAPIASPPRAPRRLAYSGG